TQVLNNIPGLLVAQHQGGAKAPQWFLRGFDADHGTDVAVYADDMPINLVSHAHGQGYADPNFLIPEVIDRVELYKGPYFPQFGDFATAGAVKLITKEEFKENFLKAEGGSFDTMRYVLGASPQLGNVKTLFAAQAYHTNGPFIHPENLWRYNGEGRMTLDPTPESKLSATVQGYSADWDASGQIPARLGATGQLNQFGAIDPSEGGERIARTCSSTGATRRPRATRGRCTGTRSATSCGCGRTSRSSPTAACASSRSRTARSRTPATGPWCR